MPHRVRKEYPLTFKTKSPILGQMMTHHSSEVIHRVLTNIGTTPSDASDRCGEPRNAELTFPPP